MKNNDFFKQLMLFTKTEDYRDLFESVHNWSYGTDFTHREDIYTNPKKFFRAFIIGQIWDLPNAISSISELEKVYNLTEEDKEEIKNWWRKLGI